MIEHRCIANDAVGGGLPRGKQRVRIADGALGNSPPDEIEVRTRAPVLRRQLDRADETETRYARQRPHALKIGVALLLLAAGCHRNRAQVGAQPVALTPPGPGTTTVDKIWILESSGAAVGDTTLAFGVAEGRTIMLRHPAPDNAIFVIVQFPAHADSAGIHDSVRVTIHPDPGHYAFTLTASGKLPAASSATFSYAMHFQTPHDAVVKYASPGRFEQVLAPAQLGPDQKVTLLAGTRPATDMLRFTLSGPGTYAAVALK